MSKKKKPGWQKKSSYEFYAISYTFIAETEKAIHVDTGDQEIWIPKSLTSDPQMDFEGNNEMEVKYWFCKQEGLL